MAIFTFDPNAALAANLIENEEHALTSANGVNHQFMIPRNAPFFNDSVVVVDKATSAILREGTDYAIGHTFDAGLQEVGKALAGAIYLLDKARSGTFIIRYRTLGGDFVTATTQALTDGLKTLNDLQTITWDDINPATIPAQWPVTPHNQTVTSIESVNEIISSVNTLTSQLRTAPPGIKTEDIVDLDEQYFTKMHEATDDIADAIRANRDKTIPHEVSVLDQNPTVTLSANVDTWQATGLAVSPTTDGTYMISYSVNPVFTGSENPKYRLRYTISSNGGASYLPVPESYTSGIPKGLLSTHTVRVEIMFEESHSGAIISSDDAGNETSSAVSIYRLGN